MKELSGWDAMAQEMGFDASDPTEAASFLSKNHFTLTPDRTSDTTWWLRSKGAPESAYAFHDRNEARALTQAAVYVWLRLKGVPKLTAFTLAHRHTQYEYPMPRAHGRQLYLKHKDGGFVPLTEAWLAEVTGHRVGRHWPSADGRPSSEADVLLLATKVNHLRLPHRIRAVAFRVGAKTLGDLLMFSAQELLDQKNFGRGSLEELRSWLATKELKLRGD